jgi:hypothetical protein
VSERQAVRQGKKRTTTARRTKKNAQRKKERSRNKSRDTEIKNTPTYTVVIMGGPQAIELPHFDFLLRLCSLAFAHDDNSLPHLHLL